MKKPSPAQTFIILIVIFIFSYFYFFFPSIFPAICLSNDFPQVYDTKNIIIHNSLSSMGGGYNLVIYGNGSAYYSTHYLNQFGAKAGILSDQRINEIISAFRNNDFFCLKDDYSPIIYFTDAGTNTLSITIDGKTKSVENYGNSAPSNFYAITTVLGEGINELPWLTTSQICNQTDNTANQVSEIGLLRMFLCNRTQT